MTHVHSKHFPSLALYQRLGVPYILHSNPWEGPLWTVHAMMLSVLDSYEDPGFYHELCHWIEASPRQRTFPDFSLGKWVNADRDSVFLTSTNPDIQHVGGTKVRGPKHSNVGWGERTTSLSEATRQESNACFALWLYEPIVLGHPWDDPPEPDDINQAAWEFAGVETPGRTKGFPARVTKRTAKIRAALCPDVPDTTVKAYLQHIHEAAK